MKRYDIEVDVNNEYSIRVQIECNNIKLLSAHTLEADGIKITLARHEGTGIEWIGSDDEEIYSRD